MKPGTLAIPTTTTAGVAIEHSWLWADGDLDDGFGQWCRAGELRLSTAVLWNPRFNLSTVILRFFFIEETGVGVAFYSIPRAGMVHSREKCTLHIHAVICMHGNRSKLLFGHV